MLGIGRATALLRIWLDRQKSVQLSQFLRYLRYHCLRIELFNLFPSPRAVEGTAQPVQVKYQLEF